jgi:hypothetical protein
MGKTLGKAALIPYIFVLMNWAPIVGFHYFVRGRPLGIWSPGAVKPTLSTCGTK